MKQYDVKDTPACHVFHNAESYEELLSGILKWWETIPHETKCIETITFEVDNDGRVDAMVFWVYLTKEKQDKLDTILLSPQLIKQVKLNPESAN